VTLLGPVAVPVPGVQKIAVLRANALGDFIVTLPGLEALRQGYPGAEIVLLGSDLHRRLLHERPSPVDRVIVVPPTRGVRNGPEASEQELARFGDPWRIVFSINSAADLSRAESMLKRSGRFKLRPAPR